MLAIVENDQGPPRAELVDDASDEVVVGRVRDTQHPRHGAIDKPSVAHEREFDEMHTVGEARRAALRNLARQTCLANAGRAGEHDQPPPRELGGDVHKVLLSSVKTSVDLVADSTRTRSHGGRVSAARSCDRTPAMPRVLRRALGPARGCRHRLAA